jgi:hypothetical protein
VIVIPVINISFVLWKGTSGKRTEGSLFSKLPAQNERAADITMLALGKSS